MTAPDTPLRAPGLLKLAMEGRAPWEFAALLAASPWLRHLPAGDGHPVVVFPGLGAPDLSTLPLRHFLRERGYAPQPWGQGFNFGPRRGVVDACVQQLQALQQQHGTRVSLIGWSLGGLYAREIAKLHPELVRCVITLGSPFAGHPRATNAWRFFELVSGHSSHDPALLAGLRAAPPVPTTSIYSRSDGVVAWQCSLNDEQPLAENIEVLASHIGMGMNPVALYAVADRLAQPHGAWQRFSAQGARRWFFKLRQPAPLAA
ncbi:MAG TPA: alpha/beta hydrolase [Ideonella sp.]|nr:alpha/beta hydrolase [Ideonella sp.]